MKPVSTDLKVMIDFYRRHQWHDCTEEMPPKGEMVIAVDHDDTPAFAEYDGEDWRMVLYCTCCTQWNETSVVRWMRLPNPPEVS